MQKEKPNKFAELPFKNSESLSLDQTRQPAKAASEEEGFRVEEISITKDGTMRAAKGLNTDTLFSVALSDDNQRFIRLENAVQALNDKINTLDPAITRLMEIDQDLNNITYQLEVLVNERDTVNAEEPTFREARAVIPVPTTPQDIAPASGGDSALGYIENIRIGDHPDKIRIVFEATEKPNFVFNFDETKKILNIDTKNSSISPDFSGIKNTSSLIEDIQTSDNQNLILLLSQSSEKINQGYIAPSNGNKSHRLFIDLKK